MELKPFIKSLSYVAVLAIIAWIVMSRPLLHDKYASSNFSHEQQSSSIAPVQSVAPTEPAIHGIDVSFYQGDIDWERVAKTKRFVYLKATEGITYQDPNFHRYQKDSSETSILIGAYHFYEPEDAPEEQVQNFLNIVKGVELDLVPMLDVEMSKGLDKQSIQNGVKQWLKIVEKEIGCRPIVYSYGDFWRDKLGPSFNDYGLWLADYAAKPTLPEGAKDWWIWQYSEKGKVPGIEHSVDLSVLASGESTLNKLRCNVQLSDSENQNES